MEPPLELARRAAHRWGLHGEPAFVRGSLNQVFRIEQGYLRLSPPAHRSPDQIEAELDWLQHLRSNGLPVCAPLPSTTGLPCEVLEEHDGLWTATLFEAAPGEPVRLRRPWTKDFVVAWGRLLARLHEASRTYRPDPGIARRPSFPDRPVLRRAERIAGSEYPALIAQRDRLRTWIANLPRNVECYGIVHGDAQPGNMHLSAEGLWLFDADSAHHNWFAYDLAVALHVNRHFPPRYDPNVDEGPFLRALLAGYRTERPLSPGWETRLSTFEHCRWLMATLHNLERWRRLGGEPGAYLRALLARAA